MKNLLICFGLLLTMGLSLSSCSIHHTTVKRTAPRDNGLHKGWFKFKIPHSPGHTSSPGHSGSHGSKGHGNQKKHGK